MTTISIKSSTSTLTKVIMVVFVIGLVVQIKGSMAQSTCPTQLSNLNVCTPFVVPGSATTTPNTECCGALQAVEHECLCNTLRVASTLPAACKLPVLNCNVSS